jgi:O-6-methylguanine DNA methyltransferase
MTSRIVFRNLNSPVGEMIAGATEHGVCFLEWHSRGGVDRILERVQKRYRMPLVAGDGEILRQLEQELAAYFNGALRQFTVPIDVTGTEFERAVWAQLLQIPYGETRSYNDIAVAIDKPKACRAVGRANGANYASILIPCHRVIESGGGLRGYGGGLWRKQFLLELERKVLRGQAVSGVEGALAGKSTEILEILSG